MSRFERPGGGLVFFSAVLIAGSLAAAALPKEWRNWSHFREVGISSVEESGELCSVAIPDGLYEHARSDLGDLRLIDQGGNEVAYVLHAPGRGAERDWREVGIIDAGIVTDQYSQVVGDSGDGAAAHDAVEVTLAPGDEDVFAWAEVAASGDRETWRVARQRAPLYRFDEEGFRGPVTIRYPRTRDRWLRLRLIDGDRELAVEKLRVSEWGEDERQRLPILRGMRMRSDSPDGESTWEPHGALPLMTISGARVETDREEFHRLVVVSAGEDGETWRQVGRGHVFRFRGVEGDDRSQRESLEVEVRETAAPYWRVTVLDRGDPPIPDLSVKLLRNRQSIVFKSETQAPLRLLYGNRRAETSEYELAKLVTSDELAAAREAELFGEQVNAAYESPEPFTERHPVILWVALGLAVVVLGSLALKSLR
jgi:hypothetical protein